MDIMDRWRAEFREECRKMSNKELLESVCELAKPDGYDCEWTMGGKWMYFEALDQLKKRLKECGFLEE